MALLAMREASRNRLRGTVWFRYTARMSQVLLLCWAALLALALCAFGLTTAALSALSLAFGALLAVCLRPHLALRREAREFLRLQRRPFFVKVQDSPELATAEDAFLASVLAQPFLRASSLSLGHVQEILHRMLRLGIEARVACAALYDPALYKWLHSRVTADEEWTFEDAVLLQLFVQKQRY